MFRTVFRCLVVLACLLLCQLAGADPDLSWVAFDSSEAAGPAMIAIDRSDAGQLRFEVMVPGVQLERLAAEGRSFTRVTVPGMGHLATPGEPDLPVLRRFIEVPAGAEASVEVRPLETRVVDLGGRGMPGLVYPAQLPVPTCDCPELRAWSFSFKPEAYDRPVRHDAASLDGSYGMRNHRMVRLTLAPVSYDPAAGTIEVIHRAVVTVHMAGGSLEATRQAMDRLGSPIYDSFLTRATLNLGLGQRDAGWGYPNAAPIEFFIVAPPSLVSELAPFVDWKTTCGYHVTVATTDVIGATTAEIKSYISGLYAGATPPVYILMIGDSPDPVPTFTTSNATGGTDLPYVQMDSDLYPDMMIARWPVDDATELIAMRDKILFYEQPTAASSAWLDRALFLGGDDYASHSMTTHQDIIAQLMAPDPNGADCDYWDGEVYDSTTAELIADVNTGRGWVVYSAHSGPSGWSGDPPLSSSDMPDFGNTDMYPISHGHSCQSNMWSSYDDVFGEAAVIQPSKGFVAYWGGSNFTYWDGDDWLERAFFDSLFDTDLSNPSNLNDMDRQYSNVAACYSGLTEVSLQGGGYIGETYYWEIYNLNGDPSLDPFTRQPLAMTVGAPVAIPPAAAPLTVSVSDTTETAISGALVAASQDGVLLGAGYTDGTGTAVFPITAPTPGAEMLVRVTAHNHLPTDASVLVAAGSDGVVIMDSAVLRCDGTVQLSVFDNDLAGAGTLSVDLSANPSGASTSVTLTEVPGSVVSFTGTATMGSTLTVADGDTLTVTYHDADTGGGSGADKVATAAIDCAGPAIGAVIASATQSVITVSFTTDEPGTTVVAYGTSSPPSSTVSASALVTDHQITIPDLEPCRTYLIEVRSADSLGNLAVDDNGGAFYQSPTAGWQELVAESFDSDPGWTIDNGGTSHGWAFGVPLGAGGDHGSEDPTAGFTGSDVYGVNLAGDYDNSLTENQLKLTTPPVDCSQATSLQLSFQAWLCVESASYDHARVQVSVDGGTTWITVQENTDTQDGGSWSLESFDLTALAAGQSDVRIRWTLGPTDGSWQFCGWNLDDVVLEGAVPCGALDTIFMDDFESGTCGGWSLEVPAP